MLWIKQKPRTTRRRSGRVSVGGARVVSRPVRVPGGGSGWSRLPTAPLPVVSCPVGEPGPTLGPMLGPTMGAELVRGHVRGYMRRLDRGCGSGGRHRRAW